jgi:hypothetical protein
MYRKRFAVMRARSISPQSIALQSDAMNQLKSVAGPSDNFSNLFEVPVLFYVAVITLYVTGLVDGLCLLLASLFVALRYVHSFIHVTYNRVTHRFAAYAAATLVLWVLWALIGFRIIALI